MPDTAVSTRALVKRYRDVTAVDSLNLDVRRGEIYGFLGRNGAGKTTTIRMLLGLIRPSSGEVTVLGRRIMPGETSVFSRVGFLVETATAYPNLTVRENLDIQRRLTGSPPRSVADSIALLRLDRTPTGAPGNSRSATSSASPSPARCCTPPNCSCSTSPPTASIRPVLSRSANCSARSPTSAASPSSCRATSSPRSPTWPTVSASSTTAASSRSRRATNSPRRHAPSRRRLHPGRTRAGAAHTGSGALLPRAHGRCARGMTRRAGLRSRAAWPDVRSGSRHRVHEASPRQGDVGHPGGAGD